MSDDASEHGRVIRYPSQQQVQQEFDIYVNAVGRVAHAWNYLHERLGRLFVRILNASDRDVAASVWYSSYNDRAQRLMLAAAIRESKEPKWSTLSDHAKDDLSFVIDETNKLGDRRDAAVHSPAMLNISVDGTEMATYPLSGHRRARQLAGKDLIVEFDYYERWADNISRFVMQAENALTFGGYSWPGKPSRPDRRRRTEILNRAPPQRPQESHPRPPQSSPP